MLKKLTQFQISFQVWIVLVNISHGKLMLVPCSGAWYHRYKVIITALVHVSWAIKCYVVQVHNNKSTVRSDDGQPSPKLPTRIAMAPKWWLKYTEHYWATSGRSSILQQPLPWVAVESRAFISGHKADREALDLVELAPPVLPPPLSWHASSLPSSPPPICHLSTTLLSSNWCAAEHRCCTGAGTEVTPVAGYECALWHIFIKQKNLNLALCPGFASHSVWLAQLSANHHDTNREGRHVILRTV